ncbi:hypothetical protein BGZ88_004704 [Linnemannia elongata]|nr:hypothetical protein BGZ88_004704 [Linnemannia elongata]
MPCRAAPPPPPPPHSTQDLTPSPAALSNPLVYRLRTCCLQEFLPRVSLVQKSTPLSSATTPRPRSNPTQLSILFDSQDHNNSHFDPRPSSHPHYPTSASPHSYSNSPHSHPNPQNPHVNPLQHHDNNHPRQEHAHQEHHDEPYASPQQQQYPSIEEDRDLPDPLSTWQPPASNIQLTQLQSALAHRFLDWALSENILSLPSSRQSETAETNNSSTTATAGATTTLSSDDAEGEHEGREQQERSIVSAGQDWAAAHDLVWPEGDYYMAKKTFIREGVAHLRRGRRYIFVEPVLGPATSYLYPKWVDSEEDEEVESAVAYEQQQEGHGVEDLVHDATAASTDQSSSSSDSGNDASVQPSMASSQPAPFAPVTASENAQDNGQDDDNVLTEQQQNESANLDDERERGRGNDKDERVEVEDKDSHKEDNEGTTQESQHHDEASDDVSSSSATTTNLEEDRAQEGLVTPLSPPSSTTNTTSLGGMDGERIEKEETDDSSAATTSPSSSTASAASATNNSPTTPSPTSSPPSSSTSTRSSFEEAPSSPLQHQSTELLEPYSPLLDPSTDGQDQFEYGLYELQFIPKIQYLLPSQFLPSRQSFIVHLDEDRPTLASPVPAHSKRSECRCQLMMRKVLMHRDLLQVWPPIPPVRTLQERQQEAEEEARMMEIKQKVQLQTSNWRKTLQTQMVACR